ncbi:hypothetical protein ACFYVL_43095 [Streptomyces sp. NPDC004111]|uniref:hypothetical protein n=1 Tax=Streptomyces sp. NPDC004111 TaxID=3364690 RepID=UPI0036ABB166
MAYDEETGTIRDVFVVERPAGTSLSDSSSPGGISALLRDATNVLAGHAVLYPADAELDEIRAEAREEGRQEGIANGAVIGVATVAVAALGAVAVKAAPHIKGKLHGLRAKLNRKPEDIAGTGPLQAVPEPPVTKDEEPPRRGRHLHVA